MIGLLLQALLEAPVPLGPGTWWEYREAYTEYVGPLDSTTEELTRFDVHQGRRGAYVVQTGGADPVSGPVESGPDWIRLTPWTGEEALPLPLEPGRAGPVFDADTQPWRVEALEDVLVPAGTFRALRCANRTWRTVSILWIAEGVGVVKEAHGLPDRRPEIERVLLRFGRGERVLGPTPR